MPTIDELARAEVRDLRRAMTDSFDIDDGIERVRRNEPSSGVTTERAPKRGWMAAAVAAAAAVAVVGVVTLNDDDSDVVDQPLDSTAPTPLETPAPVTTTPATTLVTEPATSTSSTVAAGPVDVGTVVVEHIVADVAPQRTVLYTAAVGDGVDQLGLEDCQECEPTVPWSPVRLPDGRLIIADTFNHRWVIVNDGRPSVVPWAADAMVITPPVVDDAGLVYAVMRQSIGTPNEFGELWVLDPDDLSTPIVRQPSNATPNSIVRLEATGVSVDGGLIDVVLPTMRARPEATTKLAGMPPTIDVTWGDSIRTWNVGTRYNTYLMRAPGELADGSVLVEQFGNDEWLIARLFPDGTATRTAAPYPRSWNGTRWADERGIVQLELVDDHWEIAEYALPATTRATPTSCPVDPPFRPDVLPDGFSSELLAGSGGQITVGPDGAAVPIEPVDQGVRHYAGQPGRYIDIIGSDLPAQPIDDAEAIEVLGTTGQFGAIEDGLKLAFALPCGTYTLLGYGVSDADFKRFAASLSFE